MSPNVWVKQSNWKNINTITAEEARRNADICRNVIAKNSL